MTPLLDQARDYHRLGWALVPIPAGLKRSILRDWPNRRFGVADLDPTPNGATDPLPCRMVTLDRPQAVITVPPPAELMPPPRPKPPSPPRPNDLRANRYAFAVLSAAATRVMRAQGRCHVALVHVVDPNEKRAAAEPAARHRSHLETGFDTPAAFNKQLKSRRSANGRPRPSPRLIRIGNSLLSPRGPR
jgi:hypothetical protein